MTPEERNLVTALLDKLATLEDAPRDPEAERLIRDGLRQAPNAVYALVQTVLVQDEALKQADAHIRALEGGNSATNTSSAGNTSFLGGMRDALFGRGESRGGSVPSVRPGGMSTAWNTGAPAMPAGPAGGAPYAPPIGALPGTGGGSFLGTAAAAAAGVIGGSLLMSGIRSAMAGHEGGQRAFEPQGGSPWGGSGDSGGGNLAHQAGLDDIGRGSGMSRGGEGRGYGVADDRGGDEQHDPQHDPQQDDDQYDVSDDDDDGGGFDVGGDDE